MPGKRPLEDVRVIDTTGERGALCARVLADLGAEVILVEPPGGSAARRATPLAPGEGWSVAFAYRNAGKRGVTLDLERAADRARLGRLFASADAWVESDPPGSHARPELDPEEVRREYPHLVVTSISDFGQSGPHREWAGTDMIGYATGGMLYRAGAAHRPPVVAPGAQAYDTAAVTAAFATMAALLQRRRSGRGQWIDVSVQEATANLADWSVPIYSTLGMLSHREGAGMYPVYRCSDGWLRVIVIGPRHWRSLRAWMGEPAELSDPAYEDYIGRLIHRQAIEPVIQRFLAPWRKEDAAREAQSRGIPATPVLRPGEVLDNEHTRARRTLVPLELARGRVVSVPSGFFEIDGERVGPRRGAPEVGEHDAELDAAQRPAGAAVGVTKAARLEGHGGSGTPAPSATAPGAALGAAGEAQPVAPFAGLRVIDFGVGVAGVEVGRLLAEYGALVIKVESSRAPDFIRLVIPGPMNAPFASANRSKQSFGVDLKTAAGVDLARRLVAGADVVIENSAAGVMERLGLGWADLSRINPRLVMLSSQLLGSSGPWSTWSGYGPNAHTVSGLQHLWNYPEDAEKPEGSTNIHPDHLVGRLGALGVAAALWRRERSARGAHVEVAQFEALVQLLGDLLVVEELAPGSVVPQGNRSPRGVPWGVYPCAGDDEWCAINVRSDSEWRALRTALGDPPWAASPGFDGLPGRRRSEAEIEAALAAWTCERPPAEVVDLLQSHGVAAGIVQHPVHQLADPHLRARGFFREIEQPGLGRVVLEGPGFLAEAMAPRIEPAPLLGEHTRALCRSCLGLDDAAIDALLEAGVIEQAQVASGAAAAS